MGSLLTIEFLRNHWLCLLKDSSIDDIRGKSAFETLFNAYSGESRRYHNLRHIQHMLGLLDAATISAPSARWATWFHDAVYRAGQADNEEQSAALAEQLMSALGVSKTLIAETVSIIRATRLHQSENCDPNLLSVLDADMAILGVSATEYAIYKASVRAEFGHLPDLLFNPGRRKFLQRVLHQPRIYQTKWFYDRFEQQARSNLGTELAVG